MDRKGNPLENQCYAKVICMREKPRTVLGVHLLAMLVGILIPYFCFIDADSVYYCLLKKIMINKNEISNHSSTIRLSYLSFILLYHRNEKK